MAGNFRYTAVLDACVLYPAPLRDILISLGAEGVYRARWTAEIQDEWTRNLIEKRADLNKEKLQMRLSLSILGIFLKQWFLDMKSRFCILTTSSSRSMIWITSAS